MEARSTVAGLAQQLPRSVAEPPGDDERQEGLLTVLVREDEGPVRRLPSLYFGRAQVFAHRDVSGVMERLSGFASAIEELPAKETYLVQACEIHGRRGIYARDLFNRTPFRRKLARHGLRFAEAPVVTTGPSGFECDDWGPFDPAFALVYTPDEGAVVPVSAARLAATLATFHLGGLEASEFSRLVSACRKLDAFGGDDPAAVAHKARSVPGT